MLRKGKERGGGFQKEVEVEKREEGTTVECVSMAINWKESEEGGGETMREIVGMSERKKKEEGEEAKWHQTDP